MKFDSIEDLGIVLVGVFMHLQRLSPFVQLVPNAASTLVATTLLAALVKWRPIRGPAGSAVSLFQRCLRLLLELVVVTCMVELLLVWAWTPMLVALSEVCEWAAEGQLRRQFPALAEWINSSYCTIRFLLAAGLALAVAMSQGWLEAPKTNTSNTAVRPRMDREVGGGGGQEACPARRRHQPHNRPITVRSGEGSSTRSRSGGPLVIRSATENDSRA